MRGAFRAKIILSFCLSFSCSGAAALSWRDEAGYRSAGVKPEGSGKAGFSLMETKVTGVYFTNVLAGDAYLTNAVAHNGAGVAIGDVDGDGWADIYLCSLQGPNRLYRNLGNWKFEAMEIGAADCAGQLSTGATFADVDGDGDLDLLVNGISAGTRLFLNDGKGRWTEVVDSGLSRTNSATSMTLADIDGDGDLDLYCTHYIDVMHLFDPTTRFSIVKREGRWVVLKVNEQVVRGNLKDRFEVLPDSKVRELPEMHALYRNDGHGHFTAIQSEPGVFSDEEGKPMAPPRDWGLAAMFRDMNRDGIPDLYVCNDNVSPDRIWINSGKGTFRAIDPWAFRHTSRSSMGIDFADIDRDGHDDIIVVDMLARERSKRMTQLVRDVPDRAESERMETRPQFNRNMLFMGRADGTFVETALMAGVAASDWTWCPIFLDVDLDGYEDLLVTNGFEFDVMDEDAQEMIRDPKRKFTQEQLKRSMQLRPKWPTRNAAFRNRRDGTFEPMGKEWGFDQLGVSYGMALGDLDNDGDMDVVVNNLNGAASLYRNDSSAPRIGVSLKGKAPNTEGIGARVRLVSEGLTQGQEMICGGRYLSGDEARRVFAAGGEGAKAMRLEVKWRSGIESVITNAEANQIYEVSEESANPAPEIAKNRADEPFFKDVSSWLGHVHVENSFDDWIVQPLLSKRLSRLGPGVSWYDINGDGWEDLIVGTGRGGKLGIFTNDHGAGFRAVEGVASAAGDEGAVVGWADGKGKRQLLVGVSSYEMQQESQIVNYTMTNVSAPRLMAAGKDCIGPMALGDIDGDGDLDLFMGGRFRAREYPEAVSSSVWMNEKGELQLSISANEVFKNIGMATGATFADLDGDGRVDLALAMEWGPVRVFRNVGGRFEEVTSKWGFDGRNGWWTGIAAGDFNGDGKLDLVVGNWGRNSIYELNRSETRIGAELPDVRLGVFYGDWNGDGVVELIEGWQSGTNWYPIRNRKALEAGLPELAAEFPTHEAFAKATVREILGARKAKKLEANELQSGIFLNRGSYFEWKALPREAQIAPVFSVNVGDYDGDGIEDLFLSQNFFGTVSDLTRDDNGRGLWLKGNGDGSFRAVGAEVSGIRIFGEQRGAALADFNQDGRIDLAVSQNNGATKLYLNERGKAGLRVVLHGPAGNPDGVGAQMRVVYSDGRRGPCRSVQAGSGYWSQDGAAQVLGCAEEPVNVWVRWPGGKEQTARVEGKKVEVSFEAH
jgi:hypothetical protein